MEDCGAVGKESTMEALTNRVNRVTKQISETEGRLSATLDRLFGCIPSNVQGKEAPLRDGAIGALECSLDSLEESQTFLEATIRRIIDVGLV